MNIRWSNIYVLQCLVVLNVNGLKLVPADRTVIKQNGTTRTISRYYLLPQTDDDTRVNLDSSASVDADFAKFLREFNPSRQKKIIKTKRRKPKPTKKTIKRYRIYIKRKLRRAKPRPGAKPLPKKGKLDPDMSSENQTITKIYKKRKPITTTDSTLPNSPTVSDVQDDSEENITAIKRKIVTTPPSEEIDKPKEKDDPGSEENAEPSPQSENVEATEPPPPENAENTDSENNEDHDNEPVLRTNDSEFLTVEESTHGAYQFAPEIESEATTETHDEDTTDRDYFPDVVFTKNDEPARAGDNMTEPIQSIETTSTGNEVPADPLHIEGDVPEVTTTSPKLDNYYKFDEDTTVNTDNPEYVTKDTSSNVDYVRTTTSEYGKTARSPPSEVYHYHESTEYFENSTHADYNQTQNNQSIPTPNPGYEDYVLTTTEHAEPTKKPYHLLYNVATTQLYSDLVDNFTYPAINQYSENKDGSLPYQDNNATDNEYPMIPSQIFEGNDLSTTELPKLNPENQNIETTTNPPFLGGTPPNDNFKTINIEHKVNIIDPSNLGFNNSGFAYQNQGFNTSGIEYQTYPPVHFSSYQTGDKITNNIVRPVFTNVNQIITQRPNTLNNLPPPNYNYQYPQYFYVTTYNTGGKLQESPNKLYPFNIQEHTGKPQTVQSFVYFDISRRPPFIGSSEYIKYPSYAYYNQPSTEYSKTVRSPVDIEDGVNTEFPNVPKQLSIQENAEFSAKTTSFTYPDHNAISNTAKNPPYVSPYEESTESRDANTRIPLNNNIENNGYSEAIQSPVSDLNGKSAEYPDYIHMPISVDTEMTQGQPFEANQVNDGISQTIIKPPVGYSNAEYSTYQQYPSQIANSQEYKYTQPINNKPQIENTPFTGYYKESSEVKETVDNPLASKGGSEYMEPITNSVNYVYNNPIDDYTETIIKRPVINNNQGSILKQITFQPYGGQQQSHVTKYSEGPRLPPYNVPPLSQSISNPENMNISHHEVHQQSHNIESSYVYPSSNTIKPNIQSLGLHQIPIEYLNTLTDLPNVYRPQSYFYNAISRNPPYAFNNQLISQNVGNYQTDNPLYQMINNNQVFKYPGNPSFSGYDQAPNIDITPKPAPVYGVHNPTSFPNDNSNAAPALIPTQSSSHTPEIENNSKKSIDDSELRNTSNYQWNNYLDVTTPGNDWLPEKTQINSNTNNGVNEIENEREVISHPSHQDHSMNIASLCPACFKHVTSDYILDKPIRDKNLKINLIELFKNPPANKQIKNKHIHSYHPSSVGSLTGKVKIHSIVDILKDLQRHRHPKNIYSNSYTDRDLYQIIDYLLKGDAEETDRNAKLTNVPSMELFTVDNLKNVLEAFEEYKISDIDIETANLYSIIKLILETAETQPETSEEDDGLWFNQLPSGVGNPKNNYVYNLLQQLWLQELMLQLVNNDYNLDVTRNPRWAAYLGAWRLPRNLMNTIYHQGEHLLQNPQIQGNIFGQLDGYNLEDDADSLLAYLQKYLLKTQIIYGKGSKQYYLKLNGILNRLALYFRGVGYPQYVVNALIHKLYTTLQDNISKVEPYKNSMQKSGGMCPAGR